MECAAGTPALPEFDLLVFIQLESLSRYSVRLQSNRVLGSFRVQPPGIEIAILIIRYLRICA